MSEGLRDNDKTLWKLLLLIGAVYFFLRYLCPVVSPFLLAVLFVTMFGSLFQRLQQKLRLGRQVSAVLFLIIFLALVLTVFWLLASWTVDSLPGWLESLVSWEEELEASIRQICDNLEQVFGIDGGYLQTVLTNGLSSITDYLQNDALTDLFAHAVPYLKKAGQAGMFLIAFVIASVLLAKDYDTIVNKMLEKEECHLILEVICGVIRYLAVYVRAQLLLLSFIGGTCALGLSLMRVENGLFYGLLAGLLDALPFIGTGIVLVPLAIYLFTTGGIFKGIVCLALYVVCIFIREILEPKLIGDRVGMPPLAVLVSLYAGIGLFGVSGILKGPLGYLLIKLIYESKYGTLFLGKAKEN